jgi:putative ABC transport system substrate-binding protein
LLTRLLLAFLLCAAGAVQAEPLVLFLSHTQGTDKGWERFRDEFAHRVAPNFPRAVLRRVPIRAEPLDQAMADVRALQVRPAVFVTGHTTIAQAASRVQPDVSVVLGTLADPVHLGFSDGSDPRRPMVTGFTYFRPLESKHLELVREMAPGARKVGVFVDRHWEGEALAAALLRDAPAKFGVSLSVFRMESEGDIKRELTSAAARAMDAWIVPDTPLNRSHGAEIARALHALGRPSIGAHRSHIQGGGTAAYIAHSDDLWQRMAVIVGSVLSGVPANAIAFERPTRYRLVINLDAARRLRIPVSSAMVKRADEVVGAP